MPRRLAHHPDRHRSAGTAGRAAVGRAADAWATPMWGRQHIESLVAHLTRDHVRLHGLGGELPDRPTLRELQLADAQGIWLQAENIAGGTWHPWALLERRVAVDTAHAQRIDWFAPAGVPVRTSPAHASIPDIDVHEATADTVNLSAGACRHGGHPEPARQRASAQSRRTCRWPLPRPGWMRRAPIRCSWRLIAARMDGAFSLREPAPWAAGGPGRRSPPSARTGVGRPRRSAPGRACQSARRSGRAARAMRTGVVDLVHRLRRSRIRGRCHRDGAACRICPGSNCMCVATGMAHWPRRVAAGQVQALALILPGGVRIGALDASLGARAGRSQCPWRGSKAPRAPGMPAACSRVRRWRRMARFSSQQPTRPVRAARVASDASNLHAKGQAAGPPAVDADIDDGNVAPLLQALPAGLSGPLRVHATGAARRQRGQAARDAQRQSGFHAGRVASVAAWT